MAGQGESEPDDGMVVFGAKRELVEAGLKEAFVRLRFFRPSGAWGICSP